MGVAARSKLLQNLLVVGLVMSIGCGLVPRASAQNSDFTQNVKEVYFPFNIYNKVVAPATLNADADWLKQHPDTKLWIQAYADIRGDIVYNLVLSYRRAQWIKSQLEQRGVDGSRIGYATGWGKLYQVCEKADEQCFQQNRRGDIVPPGLFVLASSNQ